MTDEKYIFIQDSKEKKRTARGAMHQRSHCGKSGAVKFPSDFLSRKELKAMNGKCETYNLNRPMTWDEFKALPDHIKKMYVKSLREKFDVTNAGIADMFGIQRSTLSHHFTCYGISNGYRGRRGYDEEKWRAWLNGEEVSTDGPEITEDIAVDICEGGISVNDESIKATDSAENTNDKNIKVLFGPVPWGTSCAVPKEGGMSFKCPADEALLSINRLLRNHKVELNVSWKILEDE